MRAFLATLLLTAFAGCATPPAGDPIRLLPGELEWKGNAGMHGLQTVTLAGDPGAPEPYAERIRIPAGMKLAPHSHPNDARMVTVLAGTLRFGFGETFDESRLRDMPAGSFFTEPRNVAHYAVAKDEVILELHAVGPAGTKYVEAGEKK